MPEEYDPVTKSMKGVMPNAIYIVFAQQSKDLDTHKMGKILEAYCWRSSGTQSQRFAYFKLLEYLKYISKYLNF